VASSGDSRWHGARPTTHLSRSKACWRGWRGAPAVNEQRGLSALVASMHARLLLLLIGVVACSDRAPPYWLLARHPTEARSNRRLDALTHERVCVAVGSAPHGGGARPWRPMEKGR
jgi:hypothetical protein